MLNQKPRNTIGDLATEHVHVFLPLLIFYRVLHGMQNTTYVTEANFF